MTRSRLVSDIPVVPAAQKHHPSMYRQVLGLQLEEHFSEQLKKNILKIVILLHILCIHKVIFFFIKQSL